MTTRPPADVGMPVADIDTRVLVVSPDNCPVVALHHIARGAVGRTIHLDDWYVAVRRGRVEALWPITARGAVP